MLLGVGIGWWLRGTKKSAIAKPENLQSEAEHVPHQSVRVDLPSESRCRRALFTSRSHQQRADAQHSSGSAADKKVLGAVSKILEANQRLAKQLQSAEEKLNEQAEQIKVHASQALTDALTGLGNRRAFDLELDRRIADFQRHGTPTCLLMLDVDHFKKFNDTHGHLAGDEVLRLVGKTLKSAVRTEDFVARYGGEEFGIILPRSNLTEALAGAERVRSEIEKAKCSYDDKGLHVTVSIGLARLTGRQSAPLFVQAADQALYAAKQGGRNQVQVNQEKAPPAAVESADRIDQKSALPVAHEFAQSDLRTDAQTGLPNRTSFCEDIRRRMAETKRHGHRISIILMQVDNFGTLLGQHGSPLEDLLLRTCTQFLSAAMRDMDLVARYGNDTFGIVLPGTALVHAAAAGERLRAPSNAARCNCTASRCNSPSAPAWPRRQPTKTWWASSNVPSTPCKTRPPSPATKCISTPAPVWNACRNRRRRKKRSRWKAHSFKPAIYLAAFLLAPHRILRNEHRERQIG